MNKKLWIIIISGLLLCSLLALMQLSGARNAASGNGNQNQPLPIQAPIPVPQPPESIAGSVIMVIAAPLPEVQPQPEPVPAPSSAESYTSVQVSGGSALMTISVVLLPLGMIMIWLLVSAIHHFGSPRQAERCLARPSIVARAEGALS